MAGLNPHSEAQLADAIGAAAQARLAPKPAAAVHGGCINESVRWESDSGPLFVKFAAAAAFPMFEAEAAGLQELLRADAVRVPAVRGVGSTSSHAWLALEWLDLGGGTPASEARLGEQLAWQHRVSAREFGWSRDNTIGSTPQPNGWQADWVGFFRERRLGYQLGLLPADRSSARLRERGERLLEHIGAFFSSYRPVPSLLHGDLWGGNWNALADGTPVIFDPAVYYGDREADIAMTRLFGGFSNAFYTAYHSAWPLDQAAGARRGLYNLYHALNHYHLFGGGYGAQAESMIDRLLAELGR